MNIHVARIFGSLFCLLAIINAEYTSFTYTLSISDIITTVVGPITTVNGGRTFTVTNTDYFESVLSVFSSVLSKKDTIVDYGSLPFEHQQHSTTVRETTNSIARVSSQSISSVEGVSTSSQTSDAYSISPEDKSANDTNKSSGTSGRLSLCTGLVSGAVSLCAFTLFVF